MKPHPHAALMAEYAKDAAETEKPWERWQIKTRCSGCWISCSVPLDFDTDYDYRRKPRTININGFDVPEPIRGRLEDGDYYFTPCISHGFANCHFTAWFGTADDDQRLEAGLCHAEQSAAEIHAKALLSFTQANPEP